MVSKKMHRLVRSLHLKKYRKKENLFLVEGEKSVQELFGANFSIKTLISTPMFLNVGLPTDLQADLARQGVDIIETDADTLGSISSLSSNRTILALVEIPEEVGLTAEKNEWVLALDKVNDPGNLGTIIRIADWYGIKKIICSEDTVDLYNPKVISSTKGSFTRVELHYTNLAEWINSQTVAAYGADLNGESVHTFKFPPGGILVMGSESHGISPDVTTQLNGKITIPAFGKAESLNVGVATAIICDNLKRQISQPAN
jgi:TrmH family RNA methyltransferase